MLFQGSGFSLDAGMLLSAFWYVSSVAFFLLGLPSWANPVSVFSLALSLSMSGHRQ